MCDEPLVSAVITVGPDECYKKYLPEAVASLLEQTYSIDEIILVDDQADIWQPSWFCETFNASLFYTVDEAGRGNRSLYNEYQDLAIIHYRTPARVGYAQAFNCGMALASSNLVLCLAADDKFYPEAAADFVETYQNNRYKDSWYNFTYELQDGSIHSAFNNICGVTKNLWRWLGGFPPSAFAAPDALLISILLKHASYRLVKVKEGKVNCWLRQHKDQDTLKQAAYFMKSGVVNTIRDLETRRFVPNKEVKLR